MRRFNGEVAVVTGAGTGIGAAVSVALAQQGLKVALVGRRQNKLERTASRILDERGFCECISADVSNHADVDRLRQVCDGLGKCVVLVNNAGVHCEMVPISKSTPSSWIQTLSVNTIGPYLMCRHFMADMVTNGWGRIFNISSAAAIGAPGAVGSVYQLSKVALNHFTRQVAVELKGTGVTANAIHPGEVMTEMWAAIKAEGEQRSDENVRRWADMVKQTGGDPPEKTAELIVDMLQEAKDEVNGKFLWIRDGLQRPRPTWD